MALFTDGTTSTLEELRGYESGLYDVASIEGIDLSQKLVLAHQELEVELTAHFFREQPEQLGRVVVTQPLHLWHIFQSLALTYRDAYNSHLNDRYLGKWREYQRMANWASRSLFETGVGLIEEAVPKAAAPTVRAVSGQGAAAMYWTRVAWVSAKGEEGCPSEPAVLAAAQGTVPEVEATEAPANASGWNVYAGLSIEDSRLQNDLPIEIGATWRLPLSGLAAGRKAGNGQQPSSYVRINRVLQRG
jgi:hypothetical protein